MIRIVITIMILIISLPVSAQNCGQGLPCGPIPYALPELRPLESPTPIATYDNSASATTPTPTPTSTMKPRSAFECPQASFEWELSEKQGPTAIEKHDGLNGVYTGDPLYDALAGGTVGVVMDGNDAVVVPSDGRISGLDEFVMSVVVLPYRGDVTIASKANDFDLRIDSDMHISGTVYFDGANATIRSDVPVSVLEGRYIDLALSYDGSLELRGGGNTVIPSTMTPGSGSRPDAATTGDLVIGNDATLTTGFDGIIGHSAFFTSFRGWAGEEPRIYNVDYCLDLSGLADALDDVTNQWSTPQVVYNIEGTPIVSNDLTSFTTNTSLFFSYAKGFTTQSFGVLSPIVSFLLVSFAISIFLVVIGQGLPILGTLIGIVRRAILFVRNLLPF